MEGKKKKKLFPHSNIVGIHVLKQVQFQSWEENFYYIRLPQVLQTTRKLHN